MRRSTSRGKGSTRIALGLVFLALQVLPAQSANPASGVLSGSVNQAPFPGPSLVDPALPTPKMSGTAGEKDKRKPSFQPSMPHPPLNSRIRETPEGESAPPLRSLGNLFELKRQEALLRREIAIRKLKDQLKGPRQKRVIDSGDKGAPMTLLAAGFENHRYAILEWNDGRRIRVRQGETLPDGSRVVRIDGSGVSVRTPDGIRTYPYGEVPANHGGRGYPPLTGFMPPPGPSAGERP